MNRYEVDILFLHFYHGGGRCADSSSTCSSGTGCCDDRHCISIECDYIFLYCERAMGAPVSYQRSEVKGYCPFNETQSYRTETKDHFLGQIYGVRNPIQLKRRSWPTSGIQFYIELIDDDRDKIGEENNELIDRFVINITESFTEQEFTGIFGLATVTLSVTIKCSENYFGQDCASYCNSTNCNQENSDNSLTMIVPSVITGALLVTLFAFGTLLIIIVYYYKNKFKNMKVSTEKKLSTHLANEASQNTSEILRKNTYEQISLESSGTDFTGIHSPNFSPRTTSEQVELHKFNVPPLFSSDHMSSICNACSSPVRSPISPLILPSSPLRFILTDTTDSYEFAIESPKDYQDEGDYGVPYWIPSNEKDKLLTQIGKLNMKVIPIENIKETDIIGSGEFGSVSRAIWIHDFNYSQKAYEEEVAIKTLKEGTSEDEKVKFLQEAAIMGQFNHPNVIRILGLVCFHEMKQYKIVMEYMTKGSLRGCLPSLNGSGEELSSQLLSFSRQIVNGMCYLSIKGCVHRDLAARNILVSEDDICKIGDFGLSRDLHSESFYLAHGGKIPVKWTAPEALHYRLWSSASDVWSYGCVLYEIWSLGYKPFHDCSNREVVERISKGYRLPPPPGCPQAIYEIMIECWNIDSVARPSFSTIMPTLNKPEYKITKWSVENKEAYSDEARTLGMPLSKGELLFVELQRTYYNN